MTAEIEHDLISKRTKEALQSIKYLRESSADKRPGKSKMDPFRPEIEALLNDGSSQKFISKR